MNNFVSVVGHIGKNPTVKVFDTGKRLAKFSIAVKEFSPNLEQPITLWFDVDAWEGLADRVQKTITKGREVVLAGRLSSTTTRTPPPTATSTAPRTPTPPTRAPTRTMTTRSSASPSSTTTRTRPLIVGEDGARYRIAVRNGTTARFEIVASVDGLDVPAPDGPVKVDRFALKALDIVGLIRFSAARQVPLTLLAAPAVGVGLARYLEHPGDRLFCPQNRHVARVRADGSIVLVGNFDVDVEHQQRIGHLFGPLPPEMRARIMSELPGRAAGTAGA